MPDSLFVSLHFSHRLVQHMSVFVDFFPKKYNLLFICFRHIILISPNCKCAVVKSQTVIECHCCSVCSAGGNHQSGADLSISGAVRIIILHTYIHTRIHRHTHSHTHTQLLLNLDTSESCQEAANAALRRLRQSNACWECLSDRSNSGCHSGSDSESHYRRTTIKIEQYLTQTHTYCMLTMPCVDWAGNLDFCLCQAVAT